MYQSDWDAFTFYVSTVLVSTHRFKNDEAHSCWVAGKVYQRCQCRVHKFSLNAGRIFFLEVTTSHTLMNDTSRPWVGQIRSCRLYIPQKRRSWFTELPNTSSCCWLERKVNRQGIFFRTPYQLVQSHFHIKPLWVTGVPNLLNFMIIRWRYTLRDVMLWYSDTWLHVVQKSERKSGVMKHKYQV